MESISSPELERLKAQLDDLALARGWSLDGYYFDESPFEGIHLVKDGELWKLYWKEPSFFFAERKFINLSDAFSEMLSAVTALKQHQVLQQPALRLVIETIPPDTEDIEMSNTSEKDESSNENNTTVWDYLISQLNIKASMLLIILIAMLFIFIVMSWISSTFGH